MDIIIRFFAVTTTMIVLGIFIVITIIMFFFLFFLTTGSSFLDSSWKVDRSPPPREAATLRQIRSARGPAAQVVR